MHVLEQLKTDHENVATLLDILDDQLQRIRANENADYDLMRDIMHYMTAYPDSFHHPMEDAVIEQLIERNPDCREMALAVVGEHRDLATKRKAFLDMLIRVIDGEIVLRKDIVARGLDYTEFLRTHMQQEEQRLFPQAEAELSEQDWNKVSEKIEQRKDPVFGQIVEAQYKSIHDFIGLKSDS